jgi:hypothetical protein
VWWDLQPGHPLTLALRGRRVTPQSREVAAAQNTWIWMAGILTVIQQTFTHNGVGYLKPICQKPGGGGSPASLTCS